ncbi:hypothetical protein [Ancylobacter polymorphus]|uniref:DUF2190 domain-containing protein n=1 Tax=Ancylobacter polymorphus TaxID=223390 RepID=A0ABU0BEU2_9HYPH|nr:hypothetical protein [Ancylobacter polymorphus]MDQ0303806.1 hypothetical protein [Ancylobacter polymorphus]
MGDFYTNPVRHPEDVGVGHIRRTISFNTSGVGTGNGIAIGALEAGAIPIRAYAVIQTAFDAGSTNVLILGTTDDDDGLVTSSNAAAGTAGLKAGTGAILGTPLAANRVVYAKYTQTGTAATAGKATLVVEFLNKRENEGTAFPNN